MMCVYVAIGIPTVLGQKRLKFFLAQDIKPSLLLDSVVIDYLYYSITPLQELPIKTSLLVSEVKK